MKKNEVFVKDFILNKDELELASRLSSAKKIKTEYVYQVVMESGCDFAIERKVRGSKRKTTLVFLVSQGQYYIETDGIKRTLQKNSLSEFLKGIGKNGFLFLNKVSWLSGMTGNPRFAQRLYQYVVCESSNGNTNAFIRQGNFFLPPHYIDIPNCLGEQRCQWNVNDGRIIRYGGEYAPNNLEDNPLNNNPFEDPFTRNPFDERNIVTKLNVYKGYGYDFPSAYFKGYDMDASYENVQFLNYKLNPTLYCWMLTYLAKRAGVTTKEVLENRVLDFASTDSLSYQSFASFALICKVYGIDIAKRAMEMFYNSGIRDILSLKQISLLLTQRTPGNLLEIESDDAFHKNYYNMSAGSFLSYLFEESKRQGYESQMNLFLYQWGQALFLQELMEVPKMEKYPSSLASKTVKLLSKAVNFSELMGKKAWKEAADVGKQFEYEGEKFKIVSAKSHIDLANEAMQQYNCVLSYEQQILNGDCLIYFMRSTDPQNEKKSILTIEVNPGLKTVQQVRARFNGEPKFEEWKFVREWEKAKGLGHMTFGMPAELMAE